MSRHPAIGSFSYLWGGHGAYRDTRTRAAVRLDESSIQEACGEEIHSFDFATCGFGAFTSSAGGLTCYGLSPNKLFEYLGAVCLVLCTVQSRDSLLRKRQCGVESLSQSPTDIAATIADFVPVAMRREKRFDGAPRNSSANTTILSWHKNWNTVFLPCWRKREEKFMYKVLSIIEARP